MKKPLLTIALGFIACVAFSQTPSLQWERNVNGQESGYDQTNKAWKDPSGNYYLTGTTNSDVFIMKADANGNQIIKFIYDSPQHGNDIGNDIKSDAAGNIYLGGLTQWNGFMTPFVAKYNSTGTLLWVYREQNLVMDGALTAINMDSYANPSNIYFTGSSHDSSAVTRLNAATGAKVWLYKYWPEGRMNDIDMDNNGHPLVCGYQSFSGNNPDFYAAVLDINTGFSLRGVWVDGAAPDSVNHSSSTQHFDIASKIKAGPSGSFAVLGTVYDNPNEATVRLYKFGSTGNTPVWAYSYNSANHTEGQAVQLFADAGFANFYWLAKANSTGGIFYTYTMAGKVNNGTATWVKEFTPAAGDLNPQDMAVDANSNAHIVANLDNPAYDILYLKLASATGSAISSLDYDNQRGGGNAYDVSTNIFVDNTSHPYIIGSSDAYTFTQFDALMVHLNTNSTLDWDIVFDFLVNTANNAVKMCVINSSGTDQVVTCGNVTNNITGLDANITSYSEAGTIQWQTNFDVNNATDIVVGFEKSPGGNFFLCTASPTITITEFYGNGQTNGISTPSFNLTNPTQYKIDATENSYITANGFGTDDYLFGTLNRNNGAVANSVPNAAGANNAYPRSLAPDNNSNAYVAGVHQVGSPIISHLMVEKFDFSANKIWSTPILGYDSTQTLNDVAKIVYDNNTNASYVAGYVLKNGSSILSTLLAKIDQSGTVNWMRTNNASNTRNEYPHDMVVSNGFIYLTGAANFPSNLSDNLIYVQKWDLNGNLLWDTTYNSPIPNADDQGTGIVVDNNGNIFVSGFCNGNPSVGSGGYDMITLKFSAANHLLWKKIYDGTNHGKDQAFGLALSQAHPTNPRVYVFGNTETNSPADADIATLKYCDLPLTTIGGASSVNICPSQSWALAANGISGGGNVVWSPGGQNSGAITINTSGNYFFTYTESDGCAENSDTVVVHIKNPPAAPQICMVTVDSASTHNILYWDKTGAGADITGYNIYREDLTNVYTYIGSRPKDSLSAYHDYGANPNVTTKRYKISAVDTCGEESAKSNFHNTVFIVSVGNGQFTWNPGYTIENSANPVNNYVLMRDDFNTGNWHQVQSTAGTQNSIADPQFNIYQPTANWHVETQWAISCTPTERQGNQQVQSTVVKSKSNITNNRTAGISNLNEQTVAAYPNPAQNSLTVTVPYASKTIVKLSDMLGNVSSVTELSFENNTRVDVSRLTSGVYMLEVSNATGKFVRKIVKE